MGRTNNAVSLKDVAILGPCISALSLLASAIFWPIPVHSGSWQWGFQVVRATIRRPGTRV